MAEKIEKKLTIDDIKNAQWELHDNWTDYNVPLNSDADQVLYHSAKATINGHEIELTYSDELEEEYFLDGKKVRNIDIFETEEDKYGNDVTTFEAFEVVENLTGQYLRDCDDLFDKWKFEQWVEEAQESYKDRHQEYIEDAYICDDGKYRIIDQQKYDKWWHHFNDKHDFCDDEAWARDAFDNKEDAEDCGRGAVENDDEQEFIDELVCCGAIEEIKEDEE